MKLNAPEVEKNQHPKSPSELEDDTGTAMPNANATGSGALTVTPSFACGHQAYDGDWAIILFRRRDSTKKLLSDESRC